MKAPEAIEGVFASITSVLTPEAERNAPLPIEVTAEGIFSEVKPESPLNALSRICLSPVGSVIFVSDRQLAKAFLSITVTEPGTV